MGWFESIDERDSFLKSSPPPSSSPQLPFHHSHTRSRSMSNSHPHYHRPRSRVPLTYAMFSLLVFASGLLAYHFVFRLYVVDEYIYGYPDVPDYEEYDAWEANLPQHNASLPLPEGRDGRFVMFSNQASGLGLNNQLQEILLLSHLAHLSHRSYVFQPYTWDAKTPYPVLDGRGGWRSSHIPLSVFISGPSAGGAFHPEDPSPRAVNMAYWEQVCPPSRRKVLHVGREKAKWHLPPDVEAKEILENWARRLELVTESCVEVTGPTIFDFGLIASPRILSVWGTLSSSPMITRFAWSAMIQAAVLRNLPMFFNPLREDQGPPEPPHLPDGADRRRSLPIVADFEPRSPNAEIELPSPGSHLSRRYLDPSRNRRPPSPSFASLTLQHSSLPQSSTNVSSSPVIPGLVAVHLRRGDFKMHCHTLADHLEPFTGWNQFPYLLDRFSPPAKDMWRGQRHDAYVRRCWPEINEVVERLREVRRLHPGLEKVFVLTNGKKEWVDALKTALLVNGNDPPEADHTGQAEEEPHIPPGGIRVQPLPPSVDFKAGWKAVYTSRDLSLMWAEKEIDQAVDMEIARRAEVFLGNGFSSLTSNIVMLRLSDHSPIQNIRFW